MAIRPGELKTPEDGMGLENRGQGASTEPRKKDTAADLKALRDRLAALRAAPAPPSPRVDSYSRDWHDKGWKAGWAACLEAIEKD